MNTELQSLQQKICQTVGEVLNISQPELDDDFFDLGGHSLLAAKVIVRLEQEFGVRVRLTEFVEDPTLRQLCNLVRTMRAGVSG